MAEPHDEEKLLREALSDAFDIPEDELETEDIEPVQDSQIESSVDEFPKPEVRPRTNSQLVAQMSALMNVIEGVTELLARFPPEERVAIMSRFCPHCGADWGSNDCECGFTRSGESS